MTTDRRPTVVPRRILVAALVVIVVVAGIAAGALVMTVLSSPVRPPAGTDVSPTPTASPMQATSQATPLATAEPTSEPTRQLQPDTIALVTVDELNLREEPSSSAKSLGHLSAGAQVFVLEGPKGADGYGWYRVVTVDSPDASECPATCPKPVGWVAGMTETQDPWLVPTELTCPPDPKLDVFALLAAFERLACYGDQRLTLKGVVWQPCCGYVGAVIYEPSWLSWPSSSAYLSWSEPLRHGGLMLRFDPRAELTVPEYADIVRVTGHLDDPAAHGCTVKVDESALRDDPTLAVDSGELAYAPIGCRTEFVVDSIEILGNTGEKCGC
jgi:hypothetical protein